MLGGGCVGNTGGDTFTFPVAAAGPADATAGQPLVFTSSGFTVTLTQARLHVGAVYLNQSAPVSGAQATGCYLTGTYVGQETSALDVDLLNPTPQVFPAAALGVTEPAVKAEQVWLTGGDINALTDPTVDPGGRRIGDGDGRDLPVHRPGHDRREPRARRDVDGRRRRHLQAAHRHADPSSRSRCSVRAGCCCGSIRARCSWASTSASCRADAASGGYAFSNDPAAPRIQPDGAVPLRATCARSAPINSPGRRTCEGRRQRRCDVRDGRCWRSRWSSCSTKQSLNVTCASDLTCQAAADATTGTSSGPAQLAPFTPPRRSGAGRHHLRRLG